MKEGSLPLFRCAQQGLYHISIDSIACICYCLLENKRRRRAKPYTMKMTNLISTYITLTVERVMTEEVESF